MTKLDAILERMPTFQRQQVEEFAARLLGFDPAGVTTGSEEFKPNRIQFDELERLLSGGHCVADEQSDDKRRTLDAWADSAED